MAEKEEKTSGQLSRQAKLLIGVVVLVVVVAALVSLYFYQQYQKSQQLLQNPTLAAQVQTQELLAKVGKLMELPSDESPQIATVSDVTKLQGNAFFANAKNGDKVLIYVKNKKAILYDPTANIIVNVAPVNIGNPTPTVTPTPTPTRRVVPRVTVTK